MIESDAYLLSNESQNKSSSKKKLAAFIAGLAIIAATLACFGAYYFYYLNIISKDSGIHIPISVHRSISPHGISESQMQRVSRILCKANIDDKACAGSHDNIDLTGDSHNILYIGTIGVGTPAQNFNVIFDTESSNLWVADNGCRKSICEHGHNTYDHTKSRTYHDLNEQFRIAYGSGNVLGYFAKETIHLGAFTMNEFQMAAVYDFSGMPQFRIFPFDGIVGLGPQGLAVDSVPPIVDVLKDSEQIEKKMFAFELREHGHQSFITIGGYRHHGITGDIQWLATNNDLPYWEIHCNKFKFGDQILARNVQLLIDSGTTGIAINKHTISAIAPIVHGFIVDNMMVLTCQNGKSAPDLQFYHGNQQFNIPFSKVLVSLDNKDFMCAALLIAFDTDQAIIVGDPLFTTYYTIFDVDAKRIGLAEYSQLPN